MRKNPNPHPINGKISHGPGVWVVRRGAVWSGGGVFDDTDTGNAPSKRMNSVCPPQVGNKSERVPRERRRSAHGVRTRDAATRLAGSGASRRLFVTHSAVAARVFRLFCRFFFSGVGGTAVVRTVEYRFSVGGARTVTRPRLIADRWWLD